MYTHYCRNCGKHYESISMNDVYCSTNCIYNDEQLERKQAEYYKKPQNNDYVVPNYGGSGQAIPIELIIFLSIGYVAWESMKKWQEFEPITSHILLIFNYLFYKPLYFSNNIHEYLSGIENQHDFGIWFFFLKWFFIIFYVIFIFSFYLMIIDMLNKKNLTWVWILLLTSPLITHGIWYFFIN